MAYMKRTFLTGFSDAAEELLRFFDGRDTAERVGKEPVLYEVTLVNLSHCYIKLAWQTGLHARRGLSEKDVVLLSDNRGRLAEFLRAIRQSAWIDTGGQNHIVEISGPLLPVDCELKALGGGARVGRASLGVKVKGLTV